MNNSYALFAEVRQVCYIRIRGRLLSPENLLGRGAEAAVASPHQGGLFHDGRDRRAFEQHRPGTHCTRTPPTHTVTKTGSLLSEDYVPRGQVLG